MTEYYFVASLLPPLEIGHVPLLGFFELKTLLNSNLTRIDKKIVHDFLSLLDMENFRALWAKEPIDLRGNYTKAQLVQILIDLSWPDNELLPFYFIDFLKKYPTDEERLRYFPMLMSEFFNDKIENETGFLKDFFAFQRDMRLVLVGFRAKKMDKNVVEELRYEDPTDPIVAQILAQRDALVYEPPFEYKELKPIFEEFSNSPFELHRALYEYQFNHIIELWGGELFSLERILHYMARLMLVERWLDLDVQEGIKVVDIIEKETSP